MRKPLSKNKADTTKTATPSNRKKDHVVNSCKLCSPLGASVVFKGVKNCMPVIHGSQGCATYIRRYMISHFREPVDIASTNFVESTTIFGGMSNFFTGVENLIKQYSPEVIAVSTSCLSETIGDDINMFLNEFAKRNPGRELPKFVTVSTPSYRGTHMEGFHRAVKALVTGLVQDHTSGDHINIFPGFLPNSDLRHLKEIVTDFGLDHVMLPDYSESLENPVWDEFQRIPQGGTPVSDIEKTGSAKATLEFGRVLGAGMENLETAGEYLDSEFNVPLRKLGIPIGLRESDEFFDTLSSIAQKEIPEKYAQERGRLVDSYIDGHKYVFDKKAVVYGDADLVAGLVSFLDEIGIKTVLCASGTTNAALTEVIREMREESDDEIEMPTIVRTEADFEDIKDLSKDLKPDIMIGDSRGYHISRELGIPLVRVGFPIHDRIGAQRMSVCAYRGTQRLFDQICNAFMEVKQDKSKTGYKYI